MAHYLKLERRGKARRALIMDGLETTDVFEMEGTWDDLFRQVRKETMRRSIFPGPEGLRGAWRAALQELVDKLYEEKGE